MNLARLGATKFKHGSKSGEGFHKNPSKILAFDPYTKAPRLKTLTFKVQLKITVPINPMMSGKSFVNALPDFIPTITLGNVS